MFHLNKIRASKFTTLFGTLLDRERKIRSALGDRLLPNVAKNGTSLSADFPKFSGDFRLSVGDSVLLVKRYNTSKSQV